MLAYYNDIEAYPCTILRRNIEKGRLPQGYVDQRDIQEVHASDLQGYQQVHLFAGIGGFPLGLTWAEWPDHLRTLTGGFPCQDISSAGKQEGLTGKKSGLWSQIVRLLEETNTLGQHYDYILIENVSNLLSGGAWSDEKEEETDTTQEGDATICSTPGWTMDDLPTGSVYHGWMGTLLRDLAGVGYDAEWCMLTAAEMGAPHLRKRLFLVAYPNRIRDGWQESSLTNGQHNSSLATSVRSRETSTQMADTDRERLSRDRNKGRIPTQETLSSTATQRGDRLRAGTSNRGSTQSRLGYLSYGLPDRLVARCTQWPANAGEPQYRWEPPRTVKHRSTDQRNVALQALGNAIVPQCVMSVAYAILQYEKEHTNGLYV